MTFFEVRSFAEALLVVRTFPDPVLHDYVRVEVHVSHIDCIARAREIYDLFLEPVERFGWTVRNMRRLSHLADLSDCLEVAEDVLEKIVRAVEYNLLDVPTLLVLQNIGNLIRLMGRPCRGEMQEATRILGCQIETTAERVMRGRWDEEELLLRVDLQRDLVAVRLEAPVTLP